MAKTTSSWAVIAKDFNSPYIRNYIWARAVLRYPELFKLTGPTMGISSRKNTIEYIADIASWQAAHEALAAQANSNTQFVEEVIDRTNTFGEAFNLWSKKELYDTNLSAKRAEELHALLDAFVEKQAELYAFGFALPILDFGGNAYVEGSLQKFLNEKAPEKYDEYYSIFTEPLHNSFAQDQEEALLRLMSAHTHLLPTLASLSVGDVEAQQPEFFAQLEEHTATYAWVYYVYMGPAFTEKEFLDFIQDYLARGINPEARLAELAERKTQINHAREAAIKELAPDSFNESIIRLAGKMVWAKPRRKDYQSRSYYHLEKLLRELSRRLYVSLTQIRSAPIELIREGLAKGELDAHVPNVVFERHVCIPQEGAAKTLVGLEANAFYDAHVEREPEPDVKDIKEFPGATAYKGVVRGTVRIINQPEDMGKMQQGDVLVSIATTPSVVPAMKKAAAIVTDEGGLTCHASIVSRELGITCVIGTKIATKVLHDGDLVEVDADKGIVRILQQEV